MENLEEICFTSMDHFIRVNNLQIAKWPSHIIYKCNKWETSQTITNFEFKTLAEGMAEAKAPWHDDVTIEFFKECWHLVGEGFFGYDYPCLGFGGILPKDD